MLKGISNNQLFYIQKLITLVHNSIIYCKTFKEYKNIRNAFKILTSIIESATGKIDILFIEIIKYFITQTDDILNKDHKISLVELV